MLFAANALQAVVTYAQIHFDDPGLGGLNSSLGVARAAISWTPATGTGNFNLASSLVFSGLTAGATCRWISTWDSPNSGTTYGNFPIVGGTTANGSGIYTLDSLPIAGSGR